MKKADLCHCNQGQTASESESTIFTWLHLKGQSCATSAEKISEEIQSAQNSIIRKFYNIFSLNYI